MDITTFEKVWNADIINKIEPLYSVAICTALIASYNDDDTTVEFHLYCRLVDHWKQLLSQHLDSRLMGPAPCNRNLITEVCTQMRKSYSDSTILSTILESVISELTNSA